MDKQEKHRRQKGQERRMRYLSDANANVVEMKGKMEAVENDIKTRMTAMDDKLDRILLSLAKQ